MPSDLSGITVLKFKQKKHSKKISDSLKAGCEKLVAIIKEEMGYFIYSALPSTALAQGYFNNFILPVTKNLVSDKSVWLKPSPKKSSTHKNKKLQKWSAFELIILVPDDLHKDYEDRIKDYIISHSLAKLEVESETRDYNFYLNATQDANDVLKLYDIPTTLSTLDNAIDRLVPKEYDGNENRLEALLKKRGIYNFVKTLEFLISEKKITKNKVRIAVVDI